ncbi:PTS system IID component (Man family) [Breznakia blatticola]|uniref:PTS system IID component (Man family) n=1 Tax=Breznakia blatticola TaxID=1754012 RepID=A0A4R7ZHP2_9FIRM|nr:PTS system mannose/fructose/sorbose family transporter subunit IID [Breznakia blatticola]TDW16745.1 PTS system IID component (Man family) [Breznakia blatticola]
MSKKGLEVQKNTSLHKKTREFFWGGWCMQTLWNYERQMNTAFMWGISNTLDRLYCEPDEDDKKKEAYQRSLEFFNITPQFGSFVMGIVAAMEEEYCEHPDTFDPRIMNNVKVALMGPLSGIGDALFQGTVRIIAMSIGISLAQQGSILGPIIAMLISFAVSFPITWFGGKLGYVKGQELLREISESDLMDKVMYACSVAGLVVVGGMVASLVNITTPISYGETFQLQPLLDNILPKMLPLAMTGIMYWIVKKGINPILVILGCFVAGVIFQYFGILAI